MAITHTTTERDGFLLDVLEDRASGLTCEFLRKGAELVSLQLRKRDGITRYLYRDGDVTPAESGWNNHATLMGYYLHRILNGRTQYRGKVIEGGTHSFLRHVEFDAPSVGNDSLTYSLDADKIAETDYPLKVRFELTYRITADGSLDVTFAFTNTEDVEAHLSFGLHPGFAVTSLESMRLLLPMGKYRRHLAPDNFLSGGTEEIDVSAPGFPFDTAELPGSFLLEFVDNTHRIVTLEDSASGRRVEVDLTHCPYLTLWSDGGPYICIEPCWGIPDHHDQRPFEEKAGIQTIEPHGKMERSFTIRVIDDSLGGGVV